MFVQRLGKRLRRDATTQRPAMLRETSSSADQRVERVEHRNNGV